MILKMTDTHDRKKHDEPEIEEEGSLEITRLTPENAVFNLEPGGFMSMKLGEEYYSRVAFFRAFPFSDPGKYISVREFEQKAKEIGMIVDINDFGGDIKENICKQINIRYFTPQILQIYNVKDEYGYAYFDVNTDKGPCKFTISIRDGGVIRLGETRLLINDIDGNRFEIKDFTKLSIKEQRKIDLYI